MTVAHILHLEVMGFLWALAGIVVYRILTRRIKIDGLLSEDNDPGKVSAGRVQLLLATFAASATYLAKVANATDGNMPDIDPNWLYVLGGSGGIFALEQGWDAWKKRKKV